MEFYENQIEDWKDLNKKWHRRSCQEMAADMVVLQEAVLKAANKLVTIALVENRPREEGEIWDIEETVVIERERMIRYWTTFGRAFQ
jgi:hypothetical protein